MVSLYKTIAIPDYTEVYAILVVLKYNFNATSDVYVDDVTRQPLKGLLRQR